MFGADGRPCRVIGVSGVFTGKPCYRVSFSDGSSVVASGDHVWRTRHRFRPWEAPSFYSGGRARGSGGGSPRAVIGNVTTAQIAESLTVARRDGGQEANHKIDCAPALRNEPIPLPVPPYVLGAWLGDGRSAGASITVGEGDLHSLVAEIEKELGVPVKIGRQDGRAPTVYMTGKRGASDGVQRRLRSLGVLGNKHIPGLYFDAGTEQRWSLLQGLMDTDGTVHRCSGKTTPRCSFSSTNERLAHDVWRLARTLGLKATRHETIAKLGGREIGKVWRVGFAASNSQPIFRLERKQRCLPDALARRSRTITITACERVDSVPTKCLAVDASDSLFLVGNGCIPTHNTALSAFLLLLHLCGPEARANSQLYSAAQSRDQAGILFSLAAKIVRMSPTLVDYVTVRDHAKQLYCPELGTLYRALSADAATAYGLSPVFIVHDELGQVRGPKSELYEALETATAAQTDPLSIVISTQAPTDADLLSVLIDDAANGHDPRVRLFLHTAPEDLDPFSEDTIRLANPAFGDFQNADEVLAMAEDARRMPSREAEYRNLILNQRVQASNPFITKSVWDANAGPVSEFTGPVYIGLDLSATTDLTAMVMVSKVDTKWHVKPTFWLPEKGLNERARADRVPYDVWREQGFLETTPGAALEYEWVVARLKEVFDRHDVRQVAFDRWNWKHFKPWLLKAGFTEEQLEGDSAIFVEFGQGYQSMSPALRDTEVLLVSGQICHGNHPVLTMCASNAVVQSDPAGNRKLAKDKSNGRIDGMVAMVMALAVAATEEQSAELDIAAMLG